MTSLSKQRIVAGGLAVAYLWWACRRIKRNNGASGIGISFDESDKPVSETQLNAYLNSHRITELVAVIASKRRYFCTFGDEKGGRELLLSGKAFRRVFNDFLMRGVPIAVWVGDHWLTRNGGEELLGE